ncbi:hypothetical protein O0I10_000140 [Lichtheimia ornata]|uniref:Polysaccharide lyase 14 domain-containing protein n=1 Tax=Lichtheimia ornata TaxID=688661 RepID=A0AAD7Y4Y8_9FUNG|nr:uncharacterized protein O0I10_000140 [Lichtheimia ornata]KAJ8663865.1 hypothetical protein O0I10_000140 [Lichtheimia ornata]
MAQQQQQQQQPMSSRAQELGLKQTWYAPMEDTTDVVGFLSNNWGVNNNNFYGNSDVSFESDPITNNASQTVMSVLYAAGSYSPSGKHAKDGSLGGAEFNAAPFGGASYDSALLSYDLAFAENFNWVLGGKLPGIYGGADDEGCSGGNQADGSNCFSMRLMWREGGGGEAYAYLPDNSICGKSNTVCNDEYGISFSRGVIRFKTNEWTKLEIYVKINNATESNGILQVWQDGSLVINQQTLKYRTTNAIAATSIMFSTFFGGGDTKYATSVDTFTYYKNIEFSVGNEVELSDSASARVTVTYSLAALGAVAGFFLLL